MVVQIIERLRRSGWVQESVQKVIAELPHWERRLRSSGVIVTPRVPSRDWSPVNSRAHNEVVMPMRQANVDRNGSREHEHRNLTGVRPYKP